MRLALGGAIALVLGGCLASDAIECADGRLCPVNTFCDDAHGGCIIQAQRDACAGREDGDACTYGTNDGRCDAEVCLRLRCGDGVVTGAEDCEPGIVDRPSCLQHGFYDEGVVGCTSACEYDTSLCTRTCDDGTIDPEEQCDSGDLDGVDDCLELGFQQSGPVSCAGNCRYDTTMCEGFCGDGVRGGAEECEGDDLNGIATCQDLGYYDGGAVTCGAGCVIDRSTCARRCNDDVLDPEEQCDGALLGDHDDCLAFGFYDAGPVTCSAACRWNLDGCTGECGDDIRNGPEECERTLSITETCQDLGFYDVGTLACASNCAFDTSLCTGSCGDRVANGGELCDGGADPGVSCSDFGYDEGAFRCTSACTFDFASCTLWSTWDVAEVPTEDLAYFWEIGGTAPDDLWLVGEAYPDDSYGGRIYHGDGLTWTPVFDLPDESFAAVWANATDDVYACTDYGSIYHYDGTAWTDMPTGTSIFLNDLWGRGDDDMFAVGGNGTILHWDGTAWTPMTSNTTRNLQGVWGFPTGEVFAVGEMVVLRYAGGTWTEIDSTSGTRRSVWGVAADDVWVSGTSALLRHWDGSVWTSFPSGTNASIEALWGTTADDIYATTSTGAILHFDGVEWDVDAFGDVTNLYGLWGTSGSDIWSVGGDWGLAWHYRHAAWDRMFANTSLTVVNTWASDVDDVYVAPPFHFDGATWTSPPVFGGMNAVHGTGPDDVYYAGNNGFIAHWNGATWTESVIAALGFNFTGVWASGPNEVFAWNRFSTSLYRYNGASWSSSSFELVSAMWGRAPGDVYAATSAGIYHWNGATWTSMPGSPSAANVWGGSGDDLFALTSSGVAYFDGTTWRPLATPEPLTQIAAGGTQDLTGVGPDGTLLHFDGLRWSRANSETPLDLMTIWSGPEVQVAGGTGGVVLVREPACANEEGSCTDGLDRDCDGSYDCSDTDCVDDPACDAGGLCAGWTPLACDSTMFGDSSASSASTLWKVACDTWDRNAREVVYRVTPPNAGTVTLDLTAPADDLDLVVLDENASGACEPRFPGCLGATDDVDHLTFTAEAGASYYVIVDSIRDAGLFTLTIDCP